MNKQTKTQRKQWKKAARQMAKDDIETLTAKFKNLEKANQILARKRLFWLISFFLIQIVWVIGLMGVLLWINQKLI